MTVDMNVQNVDYAGDGRDHDVFVRTEHLFSIYVGSTDADCEPVQITTAKVAADVGRLLLEWAGQREADDCAGEAP